MGVGLVCIGYQRSLDMSLVHHVSAGSLRIRAHHSSSLIQVALETL